MDKYIPIESLYSALNFIEQNAVKGEENNVKCITKAIRSIKFVSAEDVVKVVRCKDCKHRKDEEPSMVYCPHMIGGWVDENWFCAGGEMDEVKENE